MLELRVNTQTQQDEEFYLETTENTAFTLRVYFFEVVNGVVTAKTLAAYNTSKIFYFYDRSASEVVEVDGTVVAGLSYVEYSFTVAKTAINGRFAGSIIIYNASGDPEVWNDGQIYLKRNPATDPDATALDTTKIINWSQYTNTGQRPWLFGNETISIQSCDESPYTVNDDDSGKSFMVSEALACDFTFNLPAASNVYSSTKSQGFNFMQLNNSNVLILQANGTDTIEDSSAGGTKRSIRNYGGSQIPGSSCSLRASNTSSWVTTFADGAFITT